MFDETGPLSIEELGEQRLEFLPPRTVMTLFHAGGWDGVVIEGGAGGTGGGTGGGDGGDGGDGNVGGLGGPGGDGGFGFGGFGIGGPGIGGAGGPIFGW